jgi:hypothetical protein
VISVENPFYQFWKIMVVLTCIVSSYIYASVAAFKIPEPGSTTDKIIVSFDVIFVLDILIQFILEYKPEDQFYKVRDLTLIAKRYIRTRFFLDLITVIPFASLYSESYENRKLFYIIKIIRI